VTSTPLRTCFLQRAVCGNRESLAGVCLLLQSMDLREDSLDEAGFGVEEDGEGEEGQQSPRPDIPEGAEEGGPGRRQNGRFVCVGAPTYQRVIVNARKRQRVRLDRVTRDLGYMRRNAQGFLHQQGGVVRAESARGSYEAPGSTYIFLHKSELSTRQEEVCVSQDICNFRYHLQGN
jgi:hypothetical protein